MVYFFIIIIIVYVFWFWRWEKKDQKFYNPNRPIILGHRGSPTQITENTILSFEKALEQGVDGLEFDVRLTKDKKVVIFHDKSLSRMGGSSIKIKDIRYAELQKRLLKKQKQQEKTAKIPRLKDIEPLIQKTSLINIEIKSENIKEGMNITSPIIDFIDKNQINDRCIVSCFNPLVLLKIKWEAAYINIGFLYNRNVFFHGIFNLFWILLCRPDNLHIHYDFLNSWIVKWAKHKRLHINSYTINSKKIYEEAKNLKIDGIFTDNIEYLK